jgi:pSer/pThr/pTyr-binding forkhead associated (FHA) protein
MNQALTRQFTPEIHVQIVHVDGPFQGTTSEFNKDRITIGRDPSNDVVFPPELHSISQHHAELIRNGNEYAELIRNGNEFTFVSLGKNSCLKNQTALDTCALSPGDTIWLTQQGPKISFLSSTKHIGIEKSLVLQLDSKPQSTTKKPTRPVSRKTDFIFHDKNMTLNLHKTSVRIGSHPSCDLVTNDPFVAPLQCEISYREEQFFVRDLSTDIVTFVNDEIARPEILLQAGDIITLGTNGPNWLFLGSGKFKSTHREEDFPELKMSPESAEREFYFSQLSRLPIPDRGLTLLKSLVRNIWP